ncbi:MAG: DUF2142 domain-containing protein [Firmicutes bacterium]|nr:DUF2142 domain-containing protein [Bacillota bacterium]
MKEKKTAGLLWQELRRFLRTNWKKLLVWLLAAGVCGGCAYLTDYLSHYGLPWEEREMFFVGDVYSHHYRWETETLEPGQSITQRFTAMGNLVGSCSEVYLEVEPEQTAGTLAVQVRALNGDTLLAEGAAEVETLSEDGVVSFSIPEPFVTQSGEDYSLTFTNTSDRKLDLRVERAVQSGTLTRDGKKVEGCLNFGLLRTSLYTPSGLTRLMILVTVVTALTGLALVLFCHVKEHILYLLLAAGFGLVVLFDVTPLYGFDMKFQFDSTYVLSNELMGMEGIVRAPSLSDPDTDANFYYRRTCDDYWLYQFYQGDSVSDNYTDVAAAMKNLRLDTPEEEELMLAECGWGVISGQRPILYLPQAVAFSAARLLRLGFLPMIQLGRVAAYGVFVLLVFLAIRAMPFGKRLMLILALTPAVLVQTVSITRDAAILGLSFFLIGKVLQAAYGEKTPTWWDWIVIIAASALLAPCKSIYLPVSFFWLLAFWKRFVREQRLAWTGVALRAVCFSVPILYMLVAYSDVSIRGMLSELFRRLFLSASAETVQAAEAAAAPQMYTFSYVCSHGAQALLTFVNTLRQQLGSYLVNGIQLFDINLGSSDTVTILVVLLLFVECCGTEESRKVLGRPDRYFALLIFTGVLLLTGLAALQWTNVNDYTIQGFQGRYLTPVFPLLGVFLMNNQLFRVQGSTKTFVNAACCLYPAFCLMNMYLWTITR